jgi:phytoene synthase
MHAELQTWEQKLLSLAHEAHHSHRVPERSAERATLRATADAAQLEAAYAYCESLTAASSRSFYLASRLLPAAKRQAVRALYAFCRVTDDTVDKVAPEAALPALAEWRQRLDAPRASDYVPLAWADTRRRFAIPARYAEQLLDGVARDAVQQRYQTFADLAAYSYGVASTVGLMSMHIIGYAGPQALPYAIKLGVALQLTNILRDVAEDWRNGRVYLPQEELAAFGVAEEQIAAGRVDNRWQAFMRFQIARNHRLYAEAQPGIGLLDRDGRMAIAAASDLYRGILRAIEQRGYDNLSVRACVPTARKLTMLPGIWWRSRAHAGT